MKSRELLYLVNSRHYVLDFNFLRILLYLAERHPHTEFVVVGNFDPSALIQKIPERSRSRFTVADWSGLQRFGYGERAEHFRAQPCLSEAMYPGRAIHAYDVLVHDRSAALLRVADASAIVERIYDNGPVDAVRIIGAATQDGDFTPDLLSVVRKRGTKVYGYPLGPVVGRYAPYWINECGRVHLEKKCDAEALIERGLPAERITIETIPRFPADDTTDSGEIFIEFGVHTPRHDALAVLRRVLQSIPPAKVCIQVHRDPQFEDFVRKYVNEFGVPRIDIGNHVERALKARQALSLFPYSLYYLFENFAAPKPQVRIIDLQSRYTTVDKLAFGETPVLSDVEELLEYGL